MLLPILNASHSSHPADRWGMANTAKITTLVSTVRMSIWWWPCCAACDVYSSIRLSASSWLHRVRVWTSWNSSELPCLPYRPHERGHWTRNWIAMFCCCQSPAMATFLTTRLLTPFPQMALVHSVILVSIPNWVNTWHTVQLRRNIWDE